MRRLTAFASLAALSGVCFAPDDAAASGAAAPGQGSAAAPPASADKPEKAPATAKKVHVVWCAPGHPAYAPGMMVRAPADMADGLRSAGHARIASKEEVAAYADRKSEIADLA